jgi:hypothetical protein
MDFIMPDLISLTKMAPLLTKLAGSLAESAKGPAAKKKDELKIRFKLGFNEYIFQQATRYANVKTIIGSNIPLSLKDVYVNLYIYKDMHNNKSNNVRDDDFITDRSRFTENRFHCDCWRRKIHANAVLIFLVLVGAIRTASCVYRASRRQRLSRLCNFGVHKGQNPRTPNLALQPIN